MQRWTRLTAVLQRFHAPYARELARYAIPELWDLPVDVARELDVCRYMLTDI